MKRKKILLIGPFPPPSGGVSVHLQRLLEKSVEISGLKLAVFDIKKGRLFFDEESSGGFIKAFFYFFSAAIIHIHISHPFKIVIARIAKLTGKKVFFTIHNPRSSHEPGTSAMIRLSDMVIFVYTPADLPANGIVLPAYIPAKGSKSRAPEIPAEAGNYRNWIVSVCSFSGSLSTGNDLYGFGLILEAFSQISTAVPVALILVDPNGRLKSLYGKEIESINRRTDRKVFYIDYDIDFQKLLNRTSVFIRATASDGDALSVREALQSGTPVLASDCVSRPEGCLLFKTGDVNDFISKLDILMKENSRTVVHQHDYSKLLFELYEKELRPSS